LVASSTGVRTELYRDQFGVLLEDLDHQMLELKWLEGSACFAIVPAPKSRRGAMKRSFRDTTGPV